MDKMTEEFLLEVFFFFFFIGIGIEEFNRSDHRPIMSPPKGTLLILTGTKGGLASSFISKFLKSPYAAFYQSI